jgi:hypothetical protein
MSRFKGEVPYILLLLAAVLLLFWPAVVNPFLILHNSFGPYTDTLVIHWPKAHLMAQSYAQTTGLPGWTYMNLSGMPLAANQLAMLSYPPAWLFLILPLEPVFNGLFIFHLFLGAVAIFVLLRRMLNSSRPAAMMAGLTFGLSGKLLAHVAGGHVSLVGAIVWLAWTLVAVHGMLQATTTGNNRPRWNHGLGWLLLAVIALASQIVTHTLPVIYTVYILTAIVLWHHLVIDRPTNWVALAANVGRLAAIFVLAALLGARQLLPLLELAGYSNRALSYAQAAEFGLSPVQLLIGLLLPTTAGGHEYVIYLGLVPLILLPFGISRTQRWSIFYALLLLVAVLFALGNHTPVHRLFYTMGPGFRWVRTPARSFFVGAAALAVLVGFAVDRVAQLRWKAGGRRWLTRAGTGLIGLALLLGLGLGVAFGQWGRATLILMTVVPLTSLLLIMTIYGYTQTNLTTALLGLLLMVDMVSFDLSMMQFLTPAEAFAPGQAVATYLNELPGGESFRVYSPSYSLPSQTAAAFNVQTADGVEPVHLVAYDRFMARAGGYQDPAFSVTIPNFGAGEPATALQYVTPNLKLLGLLNVTHLAAEFPISLRGLTEETTVGNTHIYRNTLALPRAWVAFKTVPEEEDWLGQLERLPGMANVVIVPPETNLQLAETNAKAHPATITEFSSDRLSVRVTTIEPGWLVLSEIWYPGWQAIVNGRPAPVVRVNGLLRGVYLEAAGPQEISLYYRPWTVVWGGWLALGTAGLLLITGLSHFGRSVLKSRFTAHTGVPNIE